MSGDAGTIPSLGIRNPVMTLQNSMTPMTRDLKDDAGYSKTISTDNNNHDRYGQYPSQATSARETPKSA